MTSYRLSHRHQSCRGISLVEMLCVTAIIGITASAAILTASSVRPFSVEPAVRQVEAALQFARDQAASASLPVVVRFDVPTKSLLVFQRDFRTTPPTDKLLTHPATKRRYNVTIFEPALMGGAPIMNVEFKLNSGSTATEIGFLPDGTPGQVTSNTTAIPLRNPYQWRGEWQAIMGYKAADKVAHSTGDYSATTNHNSDSSFANDLARGFWVRHDTEAQVVLVTGGHRMGVHVAPFTGFVRVQGQAK